MLKPAFKAFLLDDALLDAPDALSAVLAGDHLTCSDWLPASTLTAFEILLQKNIYFPDQVDFRIYFDIHRIYDY